MNDFWNAFVFAIIGAVAAYLLILGLYIQPADVAIKAAASAVSDAHSELKRDDTLLKIVFPEWNRGRTIMTTTVDVSVYTSRVEECDSTPHQTADMSLTKPGVLAVSRDMINELGLKFGQRVLLGGYGVFEVHDVMNARYRSRVDIWSSDLTAAQLHGVVEGIEITWLSGNRSSK